MFDFLDGNRLVGVFRLLCFDEDMLGVRVIHDHAGMFIPILFSLFENLSMKNVKKRLFHGFYNGIKFHGDGTIFFWHHRDHFVGFRDSSHVRGFRIFVNFECNR